MGNRFEQMDVDIEACHDRIAEDTDLYSRMEHYCGPLERYLAKKNLYRKLIDSGMVRGWFKEFLEYWTKVLNGRPLYLHDFFFLYHYYQMKFWKLDIPKGADDKLFLQYWQRPENIYLTFHFAYRFGAEPFSYLEMKTYLKRNSRILEYGCGVAPVTTSMIKSRLRDYEYTVADIRNFPYHYAKYRLKQHHVNFVDLVPFERPVFNVEFDVVLLRTVIEHLPNPVEVIQWLTEALRPQGYLIFDYIHTTGMAMDTYEAAEQRRHVLDFIKERYKILSGELKYDASMGTTIARKVREI